MIRSSLEANTITKPGSNKGDQDAVLRAHKIATPAFRHDPLFAWIFAEEPDVDARQRRLDVFFKPIVKSGLVCGGYILDAADWGSMMVVSEPGQDYDGLSTIVKCGGIPATLSGGLRPTLVSGNMHVCNMSTRD